MAAKAAGVLFDIGGVLAALDGVPSMAALLGVEGDHEALHARWLESPAVVAHETGRIGAAEFARGVVADLKLPVTPEWFLNDFLSWYKGLLPGAVELLDEMAADLQVAALSNMSAVHWDAIVATGLTRRFDRIFVSHQIGCMKPARAAFELALEGMRLRAADVLFLDDGLRNVEVARALGIEAHVVKGPAEARAVLSTYGAIPAGVRA